MSIPRSRDLAALALLSAVCLAPLAADDDAAQRERIARERAQVLAQARAGERACAERFAVAACLKEVHTERRAALQQLDHQLALLDDALRKRRAAEREARIQQRQEAQAREDEQRQIPAPSAKPPPAHRDGAAPPPSEDAESAVPQRRRSAAATQAAEAARRAEASQRRARQAAAHRAAVEQRNRDKAAQRPVQPSLPLPGASAPVR